MHDLTEEVFREAFALGSIKYVDLHLIDGRAFVHFTSSSGAMGRIITARRKPKGYLVQTALRMLRDCGMDNVRIDMSKWRPGQEGLAL